MSSREEIGPPDTSNLAIGPSCPVRCEGCYNYFGESEKNDSLISANEITKFVGSALPLGIYQVTLSGGDPLYHPQIASIIRQLRDMPVSIKIDTVGTNLAADSRVLYKGNGIATMVEPTSLQGITRVNLPLDGAARATVNEFRKGRANLFDEVLRAAKLLTEAEVSIGFNTVCTTANVSELSAIQDIVTAYDADEWQIFEYDPSGPNPSTKKQMLKLPAGTFAAAVSTVVTANNFEVTAKSLEDRKDKYFMVDDAGMAWQPNAHKGRIVHGHIVRDEQVVLSALLRHMSQF